MVIPVTFKDVCERACEILTYEIDPRESIIYKVQDGFVAISEEGKVVCNTFIFNKLGKRNEANIVKRLKTLQKLAAGINRVVILGHADDDYSAWGQWLIKHDNEIRNIDCYFLETKKSEISMRKWGSGRWGKSRDYGLRTKADDEFDYPDSWIPE